MKLLDDLITELIPSLFSRLHKIGKNPHLVSNRANLESDCRQISDIVSALAQAGSAPALYFSQYGADWFVEDVMLWLDHERLSL